MPHLSSGCNRCRNSAVKTGVAHLLLLLAATFAHAAITGTLIDEMGKPVANATIKAYAYEDPRVARGRLLRGATDRTAIATVKSAENGAFRVEAKAPLVELAIEAADKQAAVFEAPDGHDMSLVVVRAKTTKKYRILDGTKPVADAMVVNGPFVSRSDADGLVEAHDVAGGTSRVTIVHPDYAPMTLFAPELTDVTEVPMSRGGAVRGRVLDADGQPVPNATISIHRWPFVQSATDGTFSIAHAPNNWRTIVATEGTRAGVASSKGNASVEIRLKPAASLSGTTAPGTTVYVAPPGDPESNEVADADAQGNYSFAALPASRYLVRTLRRGYSSATGDVTLAPGAKVTRTLSPKPFPMIRGRVIDAEKQPLEGAYVWFGSNQIPRSDLVVTGKNGEFSVRRTDAMGPRQSVMVAKAGYALGSSGTLAESKSDATITLVKGFPLQVRVIDKQRESVKGAVVTVMQGADDDMVPRLEAVCEQPLLGTCRNTNAAGEVNFRAVDAGYAVRVMGPAIATKLVAEQPLTAKSSPIVVQVDQGVDVSGRVLFSDGTPVAEAFVSARAAGSAFARARADGSFVMRNVLPGTLTLVAALFEPYRIEGTPLEVRAPSRDVALSIPTPARIEGRVTDKENGSPITDFQVSFGTRSGFGGMGGPPLAVHSDDGSFVIERAPAGTIEITAVAPGYTRGTSKGLTTEEGRTLRGVEVLLEKGGQLRGRVTSGGQPVAGASVRSSNEGPSRFGGMNAAPTDDNGEYFLDGLPIGDRTITVNKEGFVETRKNVEIARSKEARLDVELDHGQELRGRVVDKSGQPVAGARITIMGAGMAGGFGRRPAATDASGNFTVEGLSEGRYTVTATKTGYVDARSNDITIPATAPLTLTLETGGMISGRIVGLNGSEMSYVDVFASGSGSNARARANQDGSFTLRGVPDGRVSVSASAREMSRSRQSVSQSVEVTNGSAPFVQIDFSAGKTVSGVVTLNSKPVTAGNVMFNAQGQSGRNGQLGADGRYEVNGLEPGDYEVSVFTPGGTFQRTKYTVTGDATFDIRAEGTSVQGRVVDASTGAPISEVNVSIGSSREKPGSARQSTTGTDGRFTLDALPDGTYTVQTTSRQHYVSASETVTVRGGASPEVQIKLEKAEGTAFRVTDAITGTPLDAFISVGDGKKNVGSSSGVRDEDGAIRVYVEPGSYKATVNARGYVMQTVDFVAPSSNVQVRMQPGARLLLVAATPTPVRIVGGPRPRYAMANSTGAPMEGLASGNYTLEVLGPDRKTVLRTIPAVLTSGQTTTVTVN